MSGRCEFKHVGRDLKHHDLQVYEVVCATAERSILTRAYRNKPTKCVLCHKPIKETQNDNTPP